MSLITRCPACGTMFKVVTDQLKVSQGWVRCGHCAEVFDASVHLLPREGIGLTPTVPAPAEHEKEAAPAPTPPIPSVASAPAPPAAAAFTAAPETPAPPEAAKTAAGFPQGGMMPLRPSLQFPDEASDSAADFDPAQWREAQQEREGPPDAAWMARQSAAMVDDSGFEASSMNGFDPSQAPASPDVSFVRDARRKAFWKKPGVRAALAALALVLLAALGLQWVMQQKDSLAALEPRLAPWLQSLCVRLRCEIRPPRHIESLVIDSSTFNRIGADAYRLSFILKNTGTTPLEMPSLEVTLTDSQDQAVLRRVLVPAQFGATSATLGAQSEMAGLVNMKVSAEDVRIGASSSPASSPPAPLRVAGYRVLAFYP